MITFRGVSRVYDGKHHALDDVTFAVNRGEYVFLTGPSGAGKTTLLKHILMSEHPTSGEVTVVNHNSRHINRRAVPRLRRKLGVVFQDFRLLLDRSVFDNVAFVLRVGGVRRDKLARRVLAALASVGLTHRQDDMPHYLSGGEKQRVAIARAIVNEPYVLLADEPTGNLDPETADEIFKIFERVNTAGTALIVATHEVARASRGHHRRLSLERGKLIEDTGRVQTGPRTGDVEEGNVSFGA